MRSIDGATKTVKNLLSGTRYSIDYYQREYRWQQKHIIELVDDLTDSFLLDYRTDHSRPEVKKYRYYFLGSIIISNTNNESLIIDGQQRLTSLTLLLIYLYNRQGNRPDRVNLESLIFSEHFGEKSFNLDVPDRAIAMEALFTQQGVDTTDKPESIQNIIARYHDIENTFPVEIDDIVLPYFIDWLIEKVQLVEITAFTDEDAYTIFETMNDRGLSLTPLDMFKGYLLSNITDPAKREVSNTRWKTQVQTLADLGKEEDADAFKSWLRSQYAQTIRERKKGALPGDFDRLGTEFHRWIREHENDLSLNDSSAFSRFIERDMTFYTNQYARLRRASFVFDPTLESVYYNAHRGFTLQYPLLLASLRPDDNQSTIDRKLRIVATFIDILLARRLWNSRSISYSTMQYSMFLVMRDIRSKSVDELVSLLTARLDNDHETFTSNPTVALHKQNRPVIHHMLARLTDHVGRMAGEPSRFVEYVVPSRNRYEIEHIWANHFVRHRDEFANDYEFGAYRNRLGGLLLLPKSFNASYNDMPYEKKRPYYNTQNLLARSLHEQAYDHHPQFVHYIRASAVPFRAHPVFKRADLDMRQDLYRRLAEDIWNIDRLQQEARS